MRTRPCAVLAAAAASLVSGVAGAEEIALDVDCAALDPEARAAFEARARADLAFSRATRGRVAVSCRGAAARILWLPADGESREGTASLAFAGAGVVDEMLDVLHALVLAPPPRSLPADLPPPPPPSAEITPPEEGLRPGWRIEAGARSELWSGAIPAAVGVHAGAGVAFPSGGA
jgi:hypothetical protein